MRELLRDLSHSLRPHHWIKSLLIFVPAFLLPPLERVSHLEVAIIMFFCFSSVSSGIYLLNDCWDSDLDRFHPLKRHRPISAGRITRRAAVLFSVLLIIPAITLALSINTDAGMLISLYVGLNFVYTIWAKKIFLADALLLSSFYVIRIAVGEAVFGTELHSYCLAAFFFIFAWLAMLKRISECSQFDRPVGLHPAYNAGNIPLLVNIARASLLFGSIAVTAYLFSDEAAILYADAWILVLSLFALLYWCFKFQKHIQICRVQRDFVVLFLRFYKLQVFILIFLNAFWVLKK